MTDNITIKPKTAETSTPKSKIEAIVKTRHVPNFYDGPTQGTFGGKFLIYKKAGGLYIMLRMTYQVQ